MKRGASVAIFFIISLVIIVVVASLYYIKFDSIKYTIEGKGEEYRKVDNIAKSIEDRINFCLKETTKTSLLQAGVHGGYYDLPDNADYFFSLSYGPLYNFTTFDWEVHYTPYYFNKGIDHFPTEETLENELSKYILYYLGDCVNITMYNKEVTIKYEKPIVSTTFNNKVNIKLVYPITLSYQDIELKLKDFSNSLSFNFLEKYDLVSKIIGEQKNLKIVYP